MVMDKKKFDDRAPAVLFVVLLSTIALTTFSCASPGKKAAVRVIADADVDRSPRVDADVGRGIDRGVDGRAERKVRRRVR